MDDCAYYICDLQWEPVNDKNAEYYMQHMQRVGYNPILTTRGVDGRYVIYCLAGPAAEWRYQVIGYGADTAERIIGEAHEVYDAKNHAQRHHEKELADRFLMPVHWDE